MLKLHGRESWDESKVYHLRIGSIDVSKCAGGKLDAVQESGLTRFQCSHCYRNKLRLLAVFRELCVSICVYRALTFVYRCIYLVYRHIYMYLYTYIQIIIYVIYIYIYILICVYIYIYVHICIYLYICIYFVYIS